MPSQWYDRSLSSSRHCSKACRVCKACASCLIRCKDVSYATVCNADSLAQQKTGVLPARSLSDNRHCSKLADSLVHQRLVCCLCGLQVTIEYLRDGGHLEPLRVHTLLISTQHSPDISLGEVQDELMQHVVAPVIPQRLLTPDTQYFLNPSKRWTPSACRKHSYNCPDTTGCLTSAWLCPANVDVADTAVFCQLTVAVSPRAAAAADPASCAHTAPPVHTCCCLRQFHPGWPCG